MTDEALRQICLQQKFAEAKISFETDVLMSERSYFKSGGCARFLVQPRSEQELMDSVSILKTLGVPYKIVGRTTNLLFLDDCNYSAVICTDDLKHISHNADEKYIEALCGVEMGKLSRLFLHHSYTGFEGLEGIPGSVGGAIFMNASAYGTNLSHTLISVRALSEDGSIKTYSASEINLGYRTSDFHNKKRGEIILSARFECKPGLKKKIYQKMSLYHRKRHKYQEFNYPTLGSAFAGSIYRELARTSALYYIVSSLYYFFNYKLKFHRRESPDSRIWLNNFTVKFFHIKLNSVPFSPKDMNTLINDSMHTDIHLDYIKQIQELTSNNLNLENEIVNSF